jgi:maleate isomerase
MTVGVLTPHATPGPEIEIPVMSSNRVATDVSRVTLPGTGGRTPSAALEELRQGTLPVVLNVAAAVFAAGSIDALAYASTSSGYVIGFDAETDMVQQLRDEWALPVGSSCLAAVQALRVYGMERVTLVHPPWFDDETNDLGATYFRAQGFDAVALRANSLPDDPARVRPGPVIDWVSRHLGDQTEAVFLGGNGFHAAEAVEHIERRTGRLVLEANQVLLWSILDASGTTVDITTYGRLLRESLPAPRATR